MSGVPSGEVTASYWDGRADTFDDAPDHGLRDPLVAAAWRGLLRSVLPPPPGVVADLGCGTGSVACLLAQDGFAVHGVDLAPRMVEAAHRKAAARGVTARFAVGDVSDPPLAAGRFDAVVVRHVLWAMPDPAAAVGRWVRLLRRPGVLVLVEGRWHTGGGLPARETSNLVRRHARDVRMSPLHDAALWGAPVADERYVVVGRVP